MCGIAGHREHRLSKAAGGLKGVDRASFFEIQSYMLSVLLRNSDQMSMAHGLEFRVPLIDPVLIKHVLPVEIRETITGRASKQLLFEALESLLPPEVVTRLKRGFALPFRECMQRDLHRAGGDRMREIKLRGPWDDKIFRQVWHDFHSGRVAWSWVFSLFFLERWLQDNEVSV